MIRLSSNSLRRMLWSILAPCSGGGGDDPLVVKLSQADAVVDPPEDPEHAGQDESPVDLPVTEAHPAFLRPGRRVLRLEVIVVLPDRPLEALLLPHETVLAAAEVAMRLDPGAMA